MLPGEKMLLVCKVSEVARKRMMDEIHAQNPEWSENQVCKEFICRTLPADLMKKAYGSEGYPSDEPDWREIRRRMYERPDHTMGE